MKIFLVDARTRVLVGDDGEVVREFITHYRVDRGEWYEFPRKRYQPLAEEFKFVLVGSKTLIDLVLTDEKHPGEPGWQSGIRLYKGYARS